MNNTRFIFTAFATLSSLFFVAAPAPPSPTGGPICWPPPCVPIDGGLIFLALAGFSYVIYKMYGTAKQAKKIS